MTNFCLLFPRSGTVREPISRALCHLHCKGQRDYFTIKASPQTLQRRKYCRSHGLATMAHILYFRRDYRCS